MGASAGAHLSALVALGTQSGHFLSGAYPSDKYGMVDAKVKVLVGVFGAYDMVANWNSFAIRAQATILTTFSLALLRWRIARSISRHRR